MLTALILILVLLWLAGLVGGFMFHGLVHLLLVVALIVFIVGMIGRRRPPAI